MPDHLNIFIRSTAGEPPQSNGITERHNAILDKMINKMLLHKSNKYPIDVMVAWAVSAKNALHNYYGYSPNQLVFGKNPNYPSILVDKAIALEGKTSSELIANHLNAMHAARQAFIQSEASEKLRRAIKAKTRVSTAVVYQPADLVYFKRETSNRWKGPGTVIGRENKQISMKYVQACRLQPTKESQLTFETEKSSNETQVPAANNFSSSGGNSNISEQSNNNEIVEIYDDCDFGIQDLPGE